MRVLRGIAGPVDGDIHRLQGRTVLGRGGDSDIQVIDRDVSRHHCVLIETDSGETLVMDLSSINGTMVGGEPAAQAMLSFGAKLQIGSCLFVYEFDDLNESLETPSRDDIKLMSGPAAEMTQLRSFGEDAEIEDEDEDAACSSELHGMAASKGWPHCPSCGGKVG